MACFVPKKTVPARVYDGNSNLGSSLPCNLVFKTNSSKAVVLDAIQPPRATLCIEFPLVINEDGSALAYVLLCHATYMTSGKLRLGDTTGLAPEVLKSYLRNPEPELATLSLNLKKACSALYLPLSPDSTHGNSSFIHIDDLQKLARVTKLGVLFDKKHLSRDHQPILAHFVQNPKRFVDFDVQYYEKKGYKLAVLTGKDVELADPEADVTTEDEAWPPRYDLDSETSRRLPLTNKASDTGQGGGHKKPKKLCVTFGPSPDLATFENIVPPGKVAGAVDDDVGEPLITRNRNLVAAYTEKFEQALARPHGQFMELSQPLKGERSDILDAIRNLDVKLTKMDRALTDQAQRLDALEEQVRTRKRKKRELALDKRALMARKMKARKECRELKRLSKLLRKRERELNN
ncbi:hypothetical protein C7974DRAFT_387529 [Boeremia exigua]|uniref:uncharacterized protein n=1 Tax=Boeremia exigua TaxID=749465 RepID=UPI001E8CB995|nr:uncharacterized protein C7974DRAFT_387529 [Boeremia exigua]KAH6638912.1 hypothetical protein C7974DRAFT_387529 [Boeremia exigua]